MNFCVEDMYKREVKVSEHKLKRKFLSIVYLNPNMKGCGVHGTLEEYCYKYKGI